MKCFRCLNGNYFRERDYYDGDVLKCFACGHKVRLNGSPIPVFPEIIREVRTPKKKGVAYKI